MQSGCCLQRLQVYVTAPRACCPGLCLGASPRPPLKSVLTLPALIPFSPPSVTFLSDVIKMQSWEGPQEMSYSVRRIKYSQIISDGCLSNLIFENLQGMLPQDFPILSVLVFSYSQS